MENLGSLFWQALAMEEAFNHALKKAGRQILPIVIQSENPTLLSLPWESLHHPEKGFLSQKHGFTFYRQMTESEETQSSPPKGPLKVLLFTSQPDDLDAEKERLDTEAEQANVLDGLHKGIQEGRVVVETPDDGRFSTFEKQVREGGFHLVFLSGHGVFRDNKESGEKPIALFQFEGESGGSHLVEAQQIAKLFRTTKVRCVVLSACLLGQHASDQLNTGLAIQLLEVGVPFVVGMRESIAERMALVFSRALWDAILAKKRMDVAVQLGREAMAEHHALPDTWRGADSEEIAPVSGHWTLPILYSLEANNTLIDWDFSPAPLKPTHLLADVLPGVSLASGIPMPQRFIGRRRDLREIGRLISAKKAQQLLITGAGGQGKTTLIGRVASKLKKDGYLVIVYSAPKENKSVQLMDQWNKFVTGVQLLLDEPQQKAVDALLLRGKVSESEKADMLLGMLTQQKNRGLVLLFDSLETAQDPKSRNIILPGLHTWLAACRRMESNGPLVLATSRWTIPDWEREGGTKYPLPPAPYGDFLRFVQDQRVRVDREQLAGFHKALNGNFQGLKFFIAIQQEEKGSKDFLTRLQKAQAELRLYMAVEQVVKHLSAEERELLNRFRAFQTPVPGEGAQVIGMGLTKPEKCLDRLLNFSLMDVEWDNDLDLPLYRVSPLVGGWLADQGEPKPTEEIQKKAARYLLWILHNLNTTLSQALAAHEALLAAGLVEEDELLILGTLVGHFSMRGMHHALLKDWLPLVQNSPRKEVRGDAIGWMGKSYLHIGDYESALKFLQDSLKIRREIGDREGEGTTLNNISAIYHAKGNHESALKFLQESLKIRREIGDRVGEGVTLNNISQIYDARGDYESALKFLQESFKIHREIGDAAGMCATLFNMGMMAFENKDRKKGLFFFIEAYVIANRIGLAEALGHLENLARQLGGDGLDFWEQMRIKQGEQPIERWTVFQASPSTVDSFFRLWPHRFSSRWFCSTPTGRREARYHEIQTRYRVIGHRARGNTFLDYWMDIGQMGDLQKACQEYPQVFQ